MALTTAVSLIAGLTRTTRAAVFMYAFARSGAAVLVGVAAAILYRGTLQNVYNILWAVVFGFATLNILSLTARRFEPGQDRGRGIENRPDPDSLVGANIQHGAANRAVSLDNAQSSARRQSGHP